MYKKIDIFENGKYLCSTHWSKTCKEAKSSVLKSLQDGRRFFIMGKMLKGEATNNIILPENIKVTAHFAK